MPRDAPAPAAVPARSKGKEVRLVVDASGAEGGGLGTYVASLVGAWHRGAGADDDLFIVASESFARDARRQLSGYRVITFGSGRLARFQALYGLVERVVRDVQPDVLLAALPLVPLSRIPCPIVAICHDLRHEFRPKEFSRLQLMARAVEYSRAYRRATKLVAISDRTARDLLDRHPGLQGKVVVVHSGCDHLPVVKRVRQSSLKSGLAYAHHRNKRADLTIKAWALARSETPGLSFLSVIGASGPAQKTLSRLCKELRLPENTVRIQGVLDGAEYAQLLATSSLVIFPSSFEGFGLPILEALRYHVPVVVTPDPALLEIGADHVTVASNETPEALSSAIVTAFEIDTARRREAGAAWANRFTWAMTASAIRDVCIGAGPKTIFKGVRRPS